MAQMSSMQFILRDHCDETYKVSRLSDKKLSKFHGFKVEAYMKACSAARLHGENEDLSCVRLLPVKLWRDIFEYLSMKDIIKFVTTRRWGDFFELNHMRNRRIRIDDNKSLASFERILDQYATYNMMRQSFDGKAAKKLIIETVEYRLRGYDTPPWLPKLIESNGAKVKTLVLSGGGFDFTPIVEMSRDQNFKRFDQLEVLRLCDCEILLSQLIDILLSSPALKSLSFQDCLVHLDIHVDAEKVTFSSIEKLHVSANIQNMSPQALFSIMKHMPNLININIGNLTIDNVSGIPVGYFSKAIKLKMDELCFENQADQKIGTLFPNLENLSLIYRNQGYPDEQRFEISHWPNNAFPFLESLDIMQTEITVADLKQIVNVMPALTSVQLEACEYIDNNEFLDDEVILPPGLKEIDMFPTSDLRVVSNILRQLSNLTRLSFSQDKIFAEGDLSSLEAGSCPQMKHLTIPSTVMSYANLFYLLRACPNLVTLELGGHDYGSSVTGVDDMTHFPFLEEGALPALERLMLANHIVPIMVLESILKAAPQLKKLITSSNTFHQPLTQKQKNFLAILCDMSTHGYSAAVESIDDLKSSFTNPENIAFIEAQIQICKDRIALQESEKSLKRPVEEAQNSEPKRIRKDAE